ncbi:hypothetical protein G7Z17_g13611 [Cylindrodendrum hubeiense]|uniref:Uncharacterized protein n=1 Tax=Cylindrodendrum hubeiense TaxID=595255 RepID=A0A9P5L4G3_9HYPO|nr:hypothetical protein G7Z17_g13611 [Cylindrodendrum hubeiense]
MDASSYSNTSSASSAQQSPTVQMAPQPAPTQAKTSSTDIFLKEFNLVAEAAKRAQMAVMVRDFEDCGI